MAWYDPMTDERLHDLERIGCSGDSLMHHAITELTSEVRRLRHELADPRYQYAGGRATRLAITCREAELDSLRKELTELRSKSDSATP